MPGLDTSGAAVEHWMIGQSDLCAVKLRAHLTGLCGLIGGPLTTWLRLINCAEQLPIQEVLLDAALQATRRYCASRIWEQPAKRGVRRRSSTTAARLSRRWPGSSEAHEQVEFELAREDVSR